MSHNLRHHTPHEGRLPISPSWKNERNAVSASLDTAFSFCRMTQRSLNGSHALTRTIVGEGDTEQQRKLPDDGGKWKRHEGMALIPAKRRDFHSRGRSWLPFPQMPRECSCRHHAHHTPERKKNEPDIGSQWDRTRKPVRYASNASETEHGGQWNTLRMPVRQKHEAGRPFAGHAPRRRTVEATARRLMKGSIPATKPAHGRKA